MAENDSEEGGLGPWSNANLDLTARKDAGIGADDALPPHIRFVTNVAKLIRRRLAQPNVTEAKQPGVFLFCPDPPESISGTRRVPMLDNGLTAICGRIWFVSAGPASGHYIDYEDEGDEALFNLVAGTYGLNMQHAIIFDPRTAIPEARYYPCGLGNPDTYQVVSISSKAVDFDDVLTVVQAVYRTNLSTPDGQLKVGKLWENQTKWWPCSNAEGIIQLYLVAALAGAFPICTVRHEQPMPEGKLDIEIEQSDPLDRGIITRHAILELKVLRGFTEGGGPVSEKTTLDWVESGVKQAASYRDSRNAKWSALFCFDMRKADTGQTCFAHVIELAKQLNVFLRCWYLYATSGLLRGSSISTAN